MPGANCSIFGCSTSRRNTEIGIFEVPKAIDAEAKYIRDKLIAIIERNRQEDPSFKSQKERDTLHICELHFAPEEIQHSKYTTDRQFFLKGIIGKREYLAIFHHTFPSDQLSCQAFRTLYKRGLLKTLNVLKWVCPI